MLISKDDYRQKLHQNLSAYATSQTRALQQKVHVGCRQLGLDADARRALQLAATSKHSMKDMDHSELLMLIKRLNSDGFKLSSKGPKKHKAASRPDLRLVHVLWR